MEENLNDNYNKTEKPEFAADSASNAESVSAANGTSTAESASAANNSSTAESASAANSASTADSANYANNSSNADSASAANSASTADSANYANNSSTADSANSASTAGGESSAQSAQPNMAGNAGPKRFRRDVNQKWLGGVLAGLAQYVGNGDPLPWRLVFLLVLVVVDIPFVSGWVLVVAYVAVWAVTPATESAAPRVCAQTPASAPSPAPNPTPASTPSPTPTPAPSPAPQNNGGSSGCANGCVKVFLIFCLAALLFVAMLVWAAVKFSDTMLSRNGLWQNLPALFNVHVSGLRVYDNLDMLDETDSVELVLHADSSVIRVNVKQDKGLPPDSAVEIFPEEAE